MFETTVVIEVRKLYRDGVSQVGTDRRLHIGRTWVRRILPAKKFK